MEIIIADGLSTDGTLEIISDYKKDNNNIKVIENNERIVSTGLNCALNEAKGDIIIRMDGHTILDSEYVMNCINSLNISEAWNVGGLMKCKSNGLIDRSVSIATTSRFGIGNAYFHYLEKSKWVDTVYLGAWKRCVFETVGGFDEELVRNQDDEFNYRLIQAGGKIWLDPSIKSIYFPRNSFIKLFLQYFQYGFYKIRVIQKRGGVSSYRHLIPPTFVAMLLLTLSVYFIDNLRWPFYIIMGSYLSANIIIATYHLLKRITTGKKKYFLSFMLLPMIFFTIHFSYGIGFLCGLFYFWKKWNDRNVKDYCFNRKKFS